MKTVLFYALPARTGGTYSVVENLYYDIIEHGNAYPNIRWVFILGRGGLESCENITIRNEEWAAKTWLHRLYFERVYIRKIIKQEKIDVIVSLNMKVAGSKLPSIISLHNVLPLYPSTLNEFDSYIWTIRQKMVNHTIIKSLKKAEAILVPSTWLKKALHDRFGIDEERIKLTQVPVPEMTHFLDNVSMDEIEDLPTFIFPAAGYKYKNHKTIVEACRLLQDKTMPPYRVLFIGNTGEGKTITELKKTIRDDNLPIVFTGPYNKAQLAQKYKTDVLIFPSSIETDAFPILESMACGGMVFAVDLPYAREALEGYENKVFFKEKDPKSLSIIMEQWIRGKIQKNESCVMKRVVSPRSEVIIPIVESINKE